MRGARNGTAGQLPEDAQRKVGMVFNRQILMSYLVRLQSQACGLSVAVTNRGWVHDPQCILGPAQELKVADADDG